MEEKQAWGSREKNEMRLELEGSMKGKMVTHQASFSVMK